MKLEQISFRPIARVTFDRVEMNLLTKSALQSYSSDCKRAAQQGGLIFSFENFFKGEPEVTLSVDLRDLDLLTKIMEASHTFPGIDGVPAFSLRNNLHTLHTVVEARTPATDTETRFNSSI